ncbi:uncharacterized protein [Triticum aestivum]|uniref:uncharacterized protein isoform X2 n=1 Tax=Triticum aestivum TaxID=4565 RepID=UPI001D023368|nr:uncharacterized protein LOC123163623 isoform X2 [Triticum aestivum]
MAVDAIAATVLPTPYEFVSKHPRRRLLRPRPLNQAGRACTLAIKLESFAYIAGRHRRLPRLRSTSGLLVTSVGTVERGEMVGSKPMVILLCLQLEMYLVQMKIIILKGNFAWN